MIMRCQGNTMNPSQVTTDFTSRPTDRPGQAYTTAAFTFFIPVDLTFLDRHLHTVPSGSPFAEEAQHCYSV